VLADGIGVDVYRLGFDLFGMTGLVFGQTTTYFSAAYLMTALIFEVEQGGISRAAADSVLLIVMVFAAIGVMNAVAGWTFRAGERVDLAQEAG
jgi:hypothetical protein